MRLLCDAVAFCYGPATVLKTILSVWRAKFDHITLAATGTTLEYMSRTSLVDTMVLVDTEDADALDALLVDRWDVVLSVCNPTAFSVLRNKAEVSVYWDFLLWMRYEGGAEEFAASKYLIEMFPGCGEALGRWGHEISEPVAAPILADWIAEPPQATAGRTMISLGGQRSRLTVPEVNSIYADRIVHCVQEAQRRDAVPGDFLVVCDDATARDLGRRYPAPGWRFRSLPHEEFLDELSQCERVLTHPGLYSPFEAIGRGRPTFFLPPSNYTQVLQLDLFRRDAMAPHSIDWNDLVGRTVTPGLPEAEGVRQVLALVASLDNPHVEEKLTSTVQEWLSFSPMHLSNLSVAQRGAARHYFGDYSAFLERVGDQVVTLASAAASPPPYRAQAGEMMPRPIRTTPLA